MMNTYTIIAVASGGALGAILRMFTNGYVNRHISHALPFGTLIVNLAGSLAIGMLFAWFHANASLSPYVKSFLITGLLGALTTYSTFAIESFFLLHSGDYLHALANIMLNLVGTILMAAIGYISILHYIK